MSTLDTVLAFCLFGLPFALVMGAAGYLGWVVWDEEKNEREFNRKMREMDGKKP